MRTGHFTGLCYKVFSPSHTLTVASFPGSQCAHSNNKNQPYLSSPCVQGGTWERGYTYKELLQLYICCLVIPSYHFLTPHSLSPLPPQTSQLMLDVLSQHRLDPPYHLLPTPSLPHTLTPSHTHSSTTNLTASRVLSASRPPPPYTLATLQHTHSSPSNITESCFNLPLSSLCCILLTPQRPRNEAAMHAVMAD